MLLSFIKRENIDLSEKKMQAAYYFKFFFDKYEGDEIRS